MKALYLIALVAVVAAVALPSAAPLPKLKLNANTITVSGISAGGFMAVQYQVAFSKRINGAAVVAGGPFLCASGGEGAAFECMDDPSLISLESIMSQIKKAEADNSIDATSNLKDQTVLMFSGTGDTVVNQGCMKKLASLYQKLGVSSNNTIAEFSIDAEHSWVTNKYGNACTHLGSPYINNCNYDAGGRFLNETFTKKFHEELKPKGTLHAKNMLTFDQTAFGANPSQNSMGTTGFLYVPDQCNSLPCHLHINFHGCQQGKDTLGTTYVLQTELNEWAESNNIVVLYPQITPTTDFPIINPEGCFDWWGYTGPTYAFKNGAQMNIVHKMMAQLTGV